VQTGSRHVRFELVWQGHFGPDTPIRALTSSLLAGSTLEQVFIAVQMPNQQCQSTEKELKEPTVTRENHQLDQNVS